MIACIENIALRIVICEKHWPKIAQIWQSNNLPPTLDGWVQQLVSFDQPQLLVPQWRFPKQSLLTLHFPSLTLHLFKLLQQESVLEWLKLQEKGSMQHFISSEKLSPQLLGSQIISNRHWESLAQGPSLSPHFSFWVMLQPKLYSRITLKWLVNGNFLFYRIIILGNNPDLSMSH